MNNIINKIVTYLDENSVFKTDIATLATSFRISPIKLTSYLNDWINENKNDFDFFSPKFLIKKNSHNQISHQLYFRKHHLKTYNIHASSYQKNTAINMGWTDSPFGKCLILEKNNVIFGLAFGDIIGMEETEKKHDTSLV
jgi:hypothetical protein